jgi:hypothetical protein
MIDTSRKDSGRSRRHVGNLVLCLAVLGAIALAIEAGGQGAFGFLVQDVGELTDPITRLQERIDSGRTSLEFTRGHGYLESLLDALDISVRSQALVFSKTSLQTDYISPATPRAIYFNDDVYVGWVQGGPVIEIASADPVYGTMFFTLAQEDQPQPMFQREGLRCIACHRPARNAVPIPELLVMSVLPGESGDALGIDLKITTDRSPLNERWGGWYVTGMHGDAVHMGNTIIGGDPGWAMGQNPNLLSLEGRIDTEPYLSDDSDLVALTVLVHQAGIHNLIGTTGFSVRAAVEAERQDELRRLTPDPAPSARTLAAIREAAEPLVQAMFYVGVPPLPSPVSGTSDFAREFSIRGPVTTTGRSLHQLDLETRLPRYPLSHLVYSESFDRLPDLALDYIYTRFDEILSGKEASPDFDHLSPHDREAIREILIETKPGFRDHVSG